MASESDYLSAAEIGAIDERARLWKARGIDEPGSALDDRRKLLRHLRALAAPADGEALGRELLRLIFAQHPRPDDWWETITEEGRANYRAAALQLHTIGHAAGALSREGEIARLTAERDAARDCGQADDCATPPGCARHWEERHYELQAQIEAATDTDSVRLDEIARLEAELTSARADGAREEREAIVKQVRHWAANGRDGMPVVDGDVSLVDWVATEIAESADEIARGGR